MIKLKKKPSQLDSRDDISVLVILLQSLFLKQRIVYVWEYGIIILINVLEVIEPYLTDD